MDVVLDGYAAVHFGSEGLFCGVKGEELGGDGEGEAGFVGERSVVVAEMDGDVDEDESGMRGVS